MQLAWCRPVGVGATRVEPARFVEAWVDRPTANIGKSGTVPARGLPTACIQGWCDVAPPPFYGLTRPAKGGRVRYISPMSSSAYLQNQLEGRILKDLGR